MTIIQAAQVIQDLHEIEAQGVRLPYSCEFILKMEILGHVVDLETGAIVLGGAQERPRPTVRGMEVGEE